MNAPSIDNLPSLRYEVAATKPAGEPVEITASPEQRGALALILSLETVSGLHFSGKISRFRKSGLRLSGQAIGEIEQACVVSLEPVFQKVLIDIDRRFLPARDLKRENERIEAGELLLDPEDDNEIDELVSGNIDVWEILVEELSLAIDPFPRHPDHLGDFQEKSQVDEPNQDVVQPFAVLKTLISEKKSKK